MFKLVLRVLVVCGFTLFSIEALANEVIESANVIKKTEKRLVKRVLEILEKSDGDDVYDKDSLRDVIQTTQFEIAEAYSSIVYKLSNIKSNKVRRNTLNKLKKKLDKGQYRSIVSLLRSVDRNKKWMESADLDDLIIDRSESLAQRQTKNIKRSLFRKRNIASDNAKTKSFKRLLAGA